MVIWAEFDSFANIYLSSLPQKFHFPIEVVLNFFVNTKGRGTFEIAVLAEFFDKFFSLII